MSQSRNWHVTCLKYQYLCMDLHLANIDAGAPPAAAKCTFMMGGKNINAKVSVAVEYVTCICLRAAPGATTVCLCVAGEAVGAEEQAAVTITGVSQAAFPDHNVQYQFRTENNGGQVSSGILVFSPSFFAFQNLECNRSFLLRVRGKLCNSCCKHTTAGEQKKSHPSLCSPGDLPRGPGHRRPTGSLGRRVGSRQRRLHGGVCRNPSGGGAGEQTRPWDGGSCFRTLVVVEEK